MTEACSNLLGRIVIDPEVCHGKPVIRGLRYTVESILEYLAAGDSFEEVLEEFPDLEREDLQASTLFATESFKLRGQHLIAGIGRRDIPVVREGWCVMDHFAIQDHETYPRPSWR